MSRQSPPVYQQIRSDLLQKINDGVLVPGDRLPPEPELSKEYNVSRMTLRRALAKLEEDNHLERVPGRGTFVRDMNNDPDDMSGPNDMCIGVIVPCVTLSLYSGLIRGIEQFCHAHNIRMTLGNYDSDPQREAAYMKTFADQPCHGLIICPGHRSHENNYYQTLKARNIPYVLAGAVMPSIEADTVTCDHQYGGHLGTRSLIEAGAKRIAFLCTRLQAPSTRQRFFGYQEALMEAGIDYQPELILEANFIDGSGAAVLNAFLDKHQIDAVFSANESTTVGLFQTIHSRRGEQPKVACFDQPRLLSEPDWCIAVVQQPTQAIGQAAMNLLIEQIQSDRRDKVSRQILLRPFTTTPQAMSHEHFLIAESV